MLTGDDVPIREPLLNGQVFGQDSVVNAVYQGKIYWFWGDTNRPDYPLGNFHVPGAISELPGQRRARARGRRQLELLRRRPAASPGPRPRCPAKARPGSRAWSSSRIGDGASGCSPSTPRSARCSRSTSAGSREFNPQTQRFEKVAQFPAAAAYRGEYPDGHPFLYQDHGVEYVYYANPYPLIRVPADPEQLKTDRVLRGVYVPEARHRLAQQQFDRGPDGVLRYGWKTNTQLVRQEQQDQADRRPPDQARGVAPELARHRLRQGGGGPWRVGLLE